MEPFEADALLLNCDEFHDTESEPLSKCPTGLTREEIVSAALADASRGTACTIIVLETDLNNSIGSITRGQSSNSTRSRWINSPRIWRSANPSATSCGRLPATPVT